MTRLFVFLTLIINIVAYSQQASKVNNGQNVYATGQPRVVLSCDTLPSGLFRLYPKASVTWNWTQILGKPTFSTVATSGSYNDLLDQPIIPTNNNQLSNGSGFITASSTDVLTNKSGNISQWTNNSGYVLNTRTINTYPLSSDVVLNKSDIGLSNVDNTSDINKPISSATQTALNTKQATLVSGTNIKTIETQSLVGSGNIDLTKNDVGLSNVDNTSDANKPISTATQTALDLKLTIPSGTTLQYLRGDGSLATFPSLNSGTVTSVGVISTDFSISGSPVTTSGNITANLNTSGITAGNYRNVTFNNKGIATSGINPTFNTAVVRSLNSNYTISSTLNTRVYYTVRVAYNITILVGSTGVVNLQYSTNAGSTWITVSSISNSLNLGLALTGYNDFAISGEIPANALVRLDTTGTVNAVVTYRNGTELTY